MSRRWWAAAAASLAAALLLYSVAMTAVFPANAAVEDNSRYAVKQLRFHAAAEKLYDAVMSDDRNGQFYSLRDLRLLSSDDELRLSGGRLGWLAIDSSLREAEKEWKSGRNAGNLLQAASRIRLAADSLTAGSEALWLQYEPLIREDARQLIIAWTMAGGRGSEAASARMATLQNHWELIEPAALLVKEQEKAEELRDSILYSSKLLTSKDGSRTGWAVQSFETVSEAASRLFRSDAEAGADLPADALPQLAQPPGGWIMYSIAPLICALLIYAGWMNYRRGQHGVTVYPPPAERPSRNGVARK